MNQKPATQKCLKVQWAGHAHCQYCPIRHQTLCASLDIEKLYSLLKPIEQYRYPAKALIVAQDIPASDLYVVRKGLVKLEETLHDGNQRIVRLVQPGDVVGIEALLDHRQRYDHNAVTLKPTDVCRIPHSVFKNLFKEEPAFCDALMEQWHHQLLAANQVIVDFSTGTVRERVAKVLLQLAALAQQDNSDEIYLLSINDLSSLTGVTRESVSRIMADFKRTSLLNRSGVNKMQYDFEGLQRIANPDEEE